MNSRSQKLIEKFGNHIDAVTLSDCEKILEMFGFERHKVPGSHQLYRKKGCLPFNLPTVNGREVKKVYKIKLREFLQLEEYTWSSNNDYER